MENDIKKLSDDFFGSIINADGQIVLRQASLSRKIAGRMITISLVPDGTAGGNRSGANMGGKVLRLLAEGPLSLAVMSNKLRVDKSLLSKALDDLTSSDDIYAVEGERKWRGKPVCQYFLAEPKSAGK